ncbi:SAM-dependent methyltransferase [Microcoleus sp. FACHB-672]|uniref:SAM-dependent methyltransferase n=1 Tax=Microcoleus sp. FACHB-672 TaxID=2692825 RepID=UPI0016841328|nr:SAM-dependent methyltransferase [Microcoleus sp. FACHB-672]MBD2040096.1 SAM-dependent methyltransferase [Microcoleus sp. FACHB-672]
MSVKLRNVVPWGHSLDEYIRMFDLSAADRQRLILDCAGGAASFNLEMTRLGYKIISCDPIYQFSTSEIIQHIEESYSNVFKSVQANRDGYIWRETQSPTQLEEAGMTALRQFLDDLPAGLQQGRYVTAQLPVLPFNTGQFDLALSGHFLFTNSDILSQEFHLAALLEMCRVATEVRIFPLLMLSGEVSPWVEPVKKELESRGYKVETQPVPYEFQKGGDQMLRVSVPG